MKWKLKHLNRKVILTLGITLLFGIIFPVTITSTIGIRNFSENIFEFVNFA